MDTETQTYLYELLLDQIPKPPKNKTIWSNSPTRLGACIVEFREHPYMEAVLNNMCNVYGGTKVVLYIVHGIDNEQYIKRIVDKWDNVKLIKMDLHNIDIATYSTMLTSYDFYCNFKTEFILFFQTDSLIRKQIPDLFFEYKYVGAPWVGYPNDYPNNPHIRIGNKLVGNGGFSLRNVEKMKDICKNNTFTNIAEDVFITNHLLDSDIPTVAIANQFSVEMIPHDDPVGMHQIWKFIPFQKVKQLLKPIIDQ
uniref:DUF5672 domain-containing protein n=1 Tax=Pyramimonas orientalis virus TaxID=455367 RepID=A0A7M3UP72_POV01|nr:hypothetical protein HWQ62_00410 [Pyramimonas orientalis virus]